MNFKYQTHLLSSLIILFCPLYVFSQDKNTIGLSYHTTFEKVLIFAPKFSDKEKKQKFTTGSQVSVAYKHAKRNRSYIIGLNYTSGNLLAEYDFNSTSSKIDANINYTQISFDLLLSKTIRQFNEKWLGKIGIGLQPAILLNASITGTEIDHTGLATPLDPEPFYQYRKFNVGPLFYLGLEYQLSKSLSLELNSHARIYLLGEAHPFFISNTPRFASFMGVQLNKSL